MVQVNNFNPDEYKKLLEKFVKCRRGVKSHRIYEGLETITPGGNITIDFQYLLKKWCNTNPSGSWSSCKNIVKEIYDLLLI